MRSAGTSRLLVSPDILSTVDNRAFTVAGLERLAAGDDVSSVTDNLLSESPNLALQ